MSVPVVCLYQPLQVRQIRLVQFLEAGNGTISGKMETFDLEDESRPQYRALSYVWSLHGKRIDQTSFEDGLAILLQNQQIPVMKSLHTFFDALKAKDDLKSGTWWWIDYICINQGDNEEKGHQVRLMRLIYELAVETVVWLGDRSDDSDCAMDFIEFLHELLQENPTDHELQKYLGDNPEPEKWTALQNLLLRRWWTRVWTVQEYALAKNVSFWCGQKIVPRIAVSNALFVVDRGRASGFDDTDNFYVSWNRRRVQLLYESKQLRPEIFGSFPMSLPALAAYSSNNQATDDRDRLYGLCGLSTDTDMLEIDYELSVDETYLGFTQRFIEKHGSLDIICFAQHYHATSGCSLPSWVPDWRQKVSPIVVPTMVSQSGRKDIGNLRPRDMVEIADSVVTFSASGTVPARFNFKGSNLQVYGMVVEVIDGLGGSKASALVQSSGSPHSSTPSSKHLVSDLMNRICRVLVFDREDRYLRYPAPVADFVQDFQRFCSLAAENDVGNVNSEFKEWFERNRALKTLGSNLDSIAAGNRIGTRSTSKSHMPPNGEPHQHTHNSFLGRFYDTVVRMGQRLMTGHSGSLGMAPEKAVKGDLIVVLLGCSVPVVMRRDNHEEKYLLIGECFLEGFMSGQALEDDRFDLEEFCIC
ncbi:hypothetical protein IQ06DRAFT_294906 [Phaeosphaeriaceae sp. SRC1lsM3a]|nr:hypothetical protein IQ06DRAFT_294906 [Stagonospora sp. SRC1lsM3a]